MSNSRAKGLIHFFIYINRSSCLTHSAQLDDRFPITPQPTDHLRVSTCP